MGWTKEDVNELVVGGSIFLGIAGLGTLGVLGALDMLVNLSDALHYTSAEQHGAAAIETIDAAGSIAVMGVAAGGISVLSEEI